MKNSLLFCFMLLSASVHSQSLSINTDGSTAHGSAMLDVKSTAKGLLIPRMTKIQRNAIASPAKGLMVFVDDVDSVGFHYYNGSSWLWLEALGTAGWKTSGNAGTDTSVNFLGTTNSMPLRLKQNNQWLGQFNINNGTYFIGKDAGKKNTIAESTAFGDSAMANNIAADGNTAFGFNALKSNITGEFNTAIGTRALEKNNDATGYNTAIGSYALSESTAGVASTAVGSGALYDDISIGFNTAVGYNSMGFNTTGQANTAIGTNSLSRNETGMFNIAMGNNAMFQSDKANFNAAIGSDALRNDTSGYNTALGTLTLNQNRKGYAGVALGYSSLFNNTTGVGNTAAGAYSFLNNTTGNYGVAIGDSAGFNNTTASSNIFIGHLAGYTNTTGSNNTVLGARALYKNTTGSYNVAIGDSAGHTNSSGSSNVFIGHVAGFTNIVRSGLVMVGDSAGYACAAGADLVFIGASAGRHHRLNDANVYIGTRAGYSDSVGIWNTFIGNESGYNTKAPFASSARANTFVGHQAGYSNITGLYNTTLGYKADVLSPGLSNVTAIGSNAAVNQDNSLVLGSISGVNGSSDNTNVGIGTTTPDYRLHVSGSRTNDGGWADGIVVENTGTTGEAAISFRNTVIPSTRQWTVGMNQTSYLAFSYGASFAGSTTRLMIDTLGNVGVGTNAPTAVIDVDGTYKLGTDGTINAALIKDTVNIDVGSVPANGELDVTVALANATTNGAVAVSPSADITSGLIIAWARVSSAGMIRIRYRNLTAAPINPGAMNYYISVVQ